MACLSFPPALWLTVPPAPSLWVLSHQGLGWGAGKERRLFLLAGRLRCCVSAPQTWQLVKASCFSRGYFHVFFGHPCSPSSGPLPCTSRVKSTPPLPRLALPSSSHSGFGGASRLLAPHRQLFLLCSHTHALTPGVRVFRTTQF